MSSHAEGYVYVADEVSGPMEAARAGVRVTLDKRRPPFIVVDSDINQIIVARWPGRLWLVRIADPLTEDDERTTGMVRPVPGAGYVRAVAVDVISEIPAWHLFGSSGEAVCQVISQANALDPDLVTALVRARESFAGDAYTRAWNNWLRVFGKPVQTDDLAGTLRMSNRGPGSPINCGFNLIHRAVWDRAEVIVGDSAFIREDDETHLEPAWSAAANTLLEAAMAFGAPAVSDDEDRRIMSAAWHRVLGPSPRNSLA
jgi:hypothetical protein